MNTSIALAIVPALCAVMTATGAGQTATSSPKADATSLSTLTKALSGKWKLDVRFEAMPEMGQKAIQGPGEESWSAGPGGIDLIEQEHIPMPSGDAFLMGLIWWDGTKRQLAGLECNSTLPFTCDLKGGLNDVTITWDGRKFGIDENEVHDGKHTVWHEYWTDITPTSFLQTGDVTRPDGSTSRFMTIHATRVSTLETLQ